jgi:DNA-binding transcriptional LysR family regulator
LEWYHTLVHIPWEDIQLFLAVAESGSLSGAAKRLQVTQPTISRRLADLERVLGEALFVRAVDGATLTSFGERLAPPARHMAEWGAEVDRMVDRRETKPHGVVRITAPPGIAFDFVAPFAHWLAARLPDVRLEVLSTVQYLDLSRREADLALRFAAPAQRDVVTLAKLELEVAPFVSADYARTLPRRARLADVAWIAWAPPFDHLSPNPELARYIPGFRPVFASDDFLIQLRALDAGLGAMFLGRVEHRFTSTARLVELDVGLPLLKSTLYLAAANGALAIPRVRAVADLLTTELNRAIPKKKTAARAR